VGFEGAFMKSSHLWKYIAGAGVALATAYTGFATFYSVQVIQFQSQTLEEVKPKVRFKSPQEAGLPDPELVSLERPGQVVLKGWLFRQPQATSKCGVVLQHGHRTHRLSMLRYAPIFWKRGCHVLTVDARRHGDSPAEFATWGFHEKYDILEFASLFSKAVDIPQNKIALYGESLGGAIALQAASLEESQFAFVVTDSAFHDLPTILKERAAQLYTQGILAFAPLAFRIAGWRAGFSVENDVAPSRAAQKIKVPVLLIHSLADEFTKSYHSEEIFRNLSQKEKQLNLTDWGAQHSRSVDTRPEEYEEIVSQFVETHLPAFWGTAQLSCSPSADKETTSKAQVDDKNCSLAQQK
jgi:fermentation-respiration switch protein FrsA (DUF1100 family)